MTVLGSSHFCHNSECHNSALEGLPISSLEGKTAKVHLLLVEVRVLLGGHHLNLPEFIEGSSNVLVVFE